MQRIGWMDGRTEDRDTDRNWKIMCILLTQIRTVTCYMTDPSSRQGELPTTNKTATILTTAKIWSWIPKGLSAKTDWLTDWQTDRQTDRQTDLPTDRQLQSNSVSDPLTSRRWKQDGTPKRSYHTTSIHGVITQKTGDLNLHRRKILISRIIHEFDHLEAVFVSSPRRTNSVFK
jgi:hypothetical protein